MKVMDIKHEEFMQVHISFMFYIQQRSYKTLQAMRLEVEEKKASKRNG